VKQFEVVFLEYLTPQSLWEILFSTQFYSKLHIGLYDTKKSVEKDFRVQGDFFATCEDGRVMFDFAVHYEAAWLIFQVEFQDINMSSL
jgi:hypothetical protein